MFRIIAATGLLAAALAAQITFSARPVRREAPRAEILDVTPVWTKGAHNAFTDLIRFNDRWFLTFREGSSHASSDGAIRVLSSADATHWTPSATITYPVADLRDPKLTVTPDRRLMLTAAGAMEPSVGVRHRSLVWFSPDGRDWTSPEAIGDPNVWLWRVQWHEGKAYSMGYSTTENHFLREYISSNGVDFQVHNPLAFNGGYPNETSILFLPGDQALCLLRRDGDPATAQLGRSRPPYRGWVWQDLGVRIGGPNMLRLPDGRIVVASRLYDGNPRTALSWLDPEEPKLTEFLSLPSSGDSSYPGLVYHNETLYVSYYSSHEAHTSVYLAKVKLPPA